MFKNVRVKYNFVKYNLNICVINKLIKVNIIISYSPLRLNNNLLAQ